MAVTLQYWITSGNEFCSHGLEILEIYFRDVAAQLPSLQLRNYIPLLEVGGGIAFSYYTRQLPTSYVVGEVPIRVGSPEGESHEGGSSRAFLTNQEHISMGTSTYVNISSFSFLVFLNFPDLSLSSLCLCIKSLCQKHRSITGAI